MHNRSLSLKGIKEGRRRRNKARAGRKEIIRILLKFWKNNCLNPKCRTAINPVQCAADMICMWREKNVSLSPHVGLPGSPSPNHGQSQNRLKLFLTAANKKAFNTHPLCGNWSLKHFSTPSTQARYSFHRYVNTPLRFLCLDFEAGQVCLCCACFYSLEAGGWQNINLSRHNV